MADEPRKPRIRGRRVIERPRLIRALDRSHGPRPDARRGPGIREDRADGAVGSARGPRGRLVPRTAVGRGRRRDGAGAGGRLWRRRRRGGSTPARAARRHAGPRARGDGARGDAGRGPRRLARPGLDRRGRLPAPRRVGRVGAVRGDDRRALAAADPDREPRTALVDRRPRASSREMSSRSPRTSSR